MEELGLLIIRLIVGLTLAAHGTQKLFGWFGGYGPKGTGGYFDSLGLKPGVAMAVFVGLVETLGGLLFAAGIYTLVIGILLALTMLVAAIKGHGKAGWLAQGGFEYTLVLAAVTLGIALIGPGAYVLF